MGHLESAPTEAASPRLASSPASSSKAVNLCSVGYSASRNAKKKDGPATVPGYSWILFWSLCGQLSKHVGVFVFVIPLLKGISIAGRFWWAFSVSFSFFDVGKAVFKSSNPKP